MRLSSAKTNIFLTLVCSALFALGIGWTVLSAQSLSSTMSSFEQQKTDAETDIEEARTQLSENEKKVTESLAALRKIEEDILHSESEIDAYQNQLENINDNIFSLENDIREEEEDLEYLRKEYLKAVKKIRIARKRNSELAFIFSSKSLGEVRRKLRYMREFADWRDNRTMEIAGKIMKLGEQRELLAQAHDDAAVALRREENAKDKLAQQKTRQQATVEELEANSEALKAKIAKREAEARYLGTQISNLIAEEQAKEAARKKAEEDRIAQEKARKAEEDRIAREKERKAEEERIAQEKARKAEEDKKAKEKAKEEERIAREKARKAEEERLAKLEEQKAQEELLAQETVIDNDGESSDYDNAAKRRQRKPSEETKVETQTPLPTLGGFEGMKGRLPRPVAGNFRIISQFGVHPISPELPNIMEENLGIDVHVAKDANVTAVYDGDVIKIYDRTTIPGFRNIIVVKHGDYITVYANMETLSVRAGQSVKQGDVLGQVGTDFDDPSHGMIHFELWKNQTRLDPAAWLQ